MILLLFCRWTYVYGGGDIWFLFSWIYWFHTFSLLKLWDEVLGQVFRCVALLHYHIWSGSITHPFFLLPGFLTSRLRMSKSLLTAVRESILNGGVCCRS